MKKAIIAIGVDKTGGALPVLQAAAVGARAMADWGSSQGFDVTEISDIDGKTVLADDIFSAIKKIVETNSYGQLVIYFSGHGLLKAPGAEVWLLTGAPSNPNEAVNVFGSMASARCCGIEHVVFISDACRSSPPSVQFSAVTGSQIFPIQTSAPIAIAPEVDVFYATRPGDPAYEVPPDTASAEYRGIFSECLFNALAGKAPKAVVAHPDDPRLQVIPSRLLKRHLLEAVPDAAAAVSIKLRQVPEIRVESDLPKYLADVTDIFATQSQSSQESALPGEAPSHAVATNVQFADASTPPPPKLREAYDIVLDEFFLFPRKGQLKAFPDRISAEMLERVISAVPVQSKTALRSNTTVRDAIDHLLETKGRKSFETGTGFSIHGAEVKNILLLNGTCDQFFENGATHVRVHEDSATPDCNVHIGPNVALIRFEDGTGTGLAVLPGFVASVVAEDARIVAINYTPAFGTQKYAEYESQAEFVDWRRAFAAVAARNGTFHLDAKEVNDAADYIRLAKSLDPTLGMYAAYAHMEAGNRAGIQSVFRIMSEDVGPVFFDIAMLGHYYNPSPDAKHFPPFFPMMAQGWSYLTGLQTSMPKAALAAGRHLVPALWTTFAIEGMDILEAAFENPTRSAHFF